MHQEANFMHTKSNQNVQQNYSKLKVQHMFVKINDV